MLDKDELLLYDASGYEWWRFVDGLSLLAAQLKMGGAYAFIRPPWQQAQLADSLFEDLGISDCSETLSPSTFPPKETLIWPPNKKERPPRLREDEYQRFIKSVISQVRSSSR